RKRGGPRLNVERLYVIRQNDCRARTAGRTPKPRRTAGVPGRAGPCCLAGAAFTEGNSVHRAALTPTPCPSPCALAAQWCCPVRRQQAGRSDCAAAANTTGPISKTLSQAADRIAASRRMSLSLQNGATEEIQE